MAKKDESRKVKRARAARERAREAHTRLVLERQGDPRFVQQTHTETGRTIHLDAQTTEALEEQRQRFVEKFGRGPREDEPIFFDPDHDTPVEADFDAMFPAMRAAALHAGLGTEYIDAWQEVGYIITEENQHLFTAHEVEAYAEAVARAVANAGKG